MKRIFYLGLGLSFILYALNSIAEEDTMWQKTKGVASDTWDGTKKVTGDVWDGAKKVTGDVWDGTKNVAEDVKDGMSGDADSNHNSQAAAQNDDTHSEE